MNKALERDVYNLARSILAGYERRKKEYITTLKELHNPMKAMRYDKTAVGGAFELSQTESATERILDYEKSFNARAVNAVEQAKAVLMIKYNEDWANKIFKAICFSAEDCYRYTFNVLDRLLNLYISRRTFFRIKEEFLDTIADLMELK